MNYNDLLPLVKSQNRVFLEQRTNKRYLLDRTSNIEIKKIKRFTKIKIVEMLALLTISNVMLYAKSEGILVLYIFSVFFVSSGLIAIFGYHAFIRIPRTLNSFVSTIAVKNNSFEIYTCSVDLLGRKLNSQTVQVKTCQTRKIEGNSFLKNKSLALNCLELNTEKGQFIILKDHFDSQFFEDQQLNDH